MIRRFVIDLSYVAAAVLFIAGLKLLSRPRYARRGNAVSALGMLLAIGATLLHRGIDWTWILAGSAAGAAIGAVSARLVKMTAMPEMVGLFNGFGGLASLLVGWAEYHRWVALAQAPAQPVFTAFTIYAAIVIGGVTFSGSVVAFLKLAEWITGRPILFRGQHAVNSVLGLLLLAGWAAILWRPDTGHPIAIPAVVVSLALGVLLVIPIGGADMPVVISLLNSYSGLAACATGFVIRNTLLIVAGALVGASGLILTRIMCLAMNRSLSNVLFGGFGAIRAGTAVEGARGEVKPIQPDEAFYLLEAARSVVIVPGYGMAVAQAQHAVRELAQLLEANGADVRFAIHPVAGRMPGHMNVLLAEANVPYEQLAVPEDVNPIMDTVDVALVIGANDVVNPAAKEDPKSPLYGMPIIEVDRARTCIVLKRSLNPGFAGVENPLFFKPNTRMLFGDAKQSLSALIAEFKESAAGA